MKKILIANRGEIAVRIIRTCRDMGLGTVAVYSECDRTALHVRLADEAYAIGPDPASESYLRIDKIVDVARRARADAVHPGYGFLAENPQLAQACSDARLTFIGPMPSAMQTMGSKTAARQIATDAGVPIVPGMQVPLAADTTDPDIEQIASTIGYPLLVKAVAGGGGKGMRVVRDRHELAGALGMARSEARSAFGDDAVYFERVIASPRHIEVQLLGDSHGTIVPFVERECSIQRRHQKLIEETPSPAVTVALRDKLAAAAAAIGRRVGYTSAGTVEFLVDAAGQFYFLEMNTRLQVEHPITEAVSGIDFVRAQIEIAQGAPIADSLKTDPGPVFRGHAIECRVYAEDPEQGFLPSPGTISNLRPPSGPGIRDDSGAVAGWAVPTSYDPLISKVIAWAPDRPGAIRRMVRALNEYEVRGIRTTIGFCRWLLDTPEFQAGDFDTTSAERFAATYAAARRAADPAAEELAAVAAALHAFGATGARRPIRSEPEESLWARAARLDALR